jgi:hypothetical protein
MPSERFSPDDPREWLNRARSNLARAQTKITGVYLEDLCFDAQQAAEKAIKALLIKRGVTFPYATIWLALSPCWRKLDKKSPNSCGGRKH